MRIDIREQNDEDLTEIVFANEKMIYIMDSGCFIIEDEYGDQVQVNRSEAKDLIRAIEKYLELC